MPSQNSINNEIEDNDFSVNRATAGTLVFSTATHSDNTNAASHAVQRARVGGASGGDPTVNWNIAGVQDMAMGMDNSDGDILKITTGSDPSSGTSVWEMTTAGERTMPLQPAFRAFGAAQANVTGNSTVYTILYSTEEYDQNADFSSPSFTAPVDGKYHFDVSVGLTGITTCNNIAFCFLYNAANRCYWQMNPTSIIVTGNLIVNGSLDIEMNATETMAVTVSGAGQGADTIDIQAGADRTFFSGHLIC